MPFGVAFGAAASDAGLPPWQASALSVFVFAGSAQFAAVEVVGHGGAALAAVAAGLLLNLRSLAFGVAMAPSLAGPWWKRALWSHLMIDEATAVGVGQSDHRWRRYGFVVTGLAIFVAWNLSTVVGAAALASGGDLVTAWGIDATGPAAFLALLWPRLSRPDQRRTALAGAAVALAVLPFTPPGVPVVAATAGVAVAWARRPPPADAP